MTNGFHREQANHDKTTSSLAKQGQLSDAESGPDEEASPPDDRPADAKAEETDEARICD